MPNYRTTKNYPLRRQPPLSLSSESGRTDSPPKSTTTESTHHGDGADTTQRRDHGGRGGGPGTDPSQAGDEALAALSALRTDQKIALAGAVVAGLGSVLPWATVLGTSISGLQGDGSITLILAIIAAAVTIVQPDVVGRWNNAIIGGCGVLIFLIGLVDLTSFAAIGLYLTIIGGLVAAFPQIAYMYRRYQNSAPEGA